MNYTQKMIDAFLNYSKAKDIAAAAGVSQRTVERLRANDEFMGILQQIKDDYIKTASNKLQTAAATVADKLIEIITSDDAEITIANKLKAISIFFDVTLTIKGNMEILERIEKIEQQNGVDIDAELEL